MSVMVPSELGGLKKLNDGKNIPMIGLGISRIVGQESVLVSVDAALAAGYRLFDTAELYKNETELGDALKQSLPKYGLKREDIFITTKVQTLDEDPAGWVVKSVEQSLSKLQTEYLDLVLIHFPRDRYTGVDGATEMNKRGRKLVWQELEKYQEKGIIRSIGVSNFTIYHLQELAEYAKRMPAVNQIEFHPYLTLDQIRQYCQERNIFIQAFSSLCWGNQDILNESSIQQMASKYNVTTQTILYAFALNCGIGIIPKSATPSRIANNITKSASVKFTKEELDSLLALDKNCMFCPRCNPHKVL